MNYPSLDDLQRAAARFTNTRGMAARRDVLRRIASVTVPAEVPPELRAAAIAAFEGRSPSSSLLTPSGDIDQPAVIARWNASGKAAQ